MTRLCLLSLSVLLALTSQVEAQRQMENLSRGIVAIRQDDASVYVGWRLLGTDPDEIQFNVYRQSSGEPSQKVNESPLGGATNLVDRSASQDFQGEYFVRPIVGGEELAATKAVPIWNQNYKEIPISPLEGYRPGDASVADLDGDGQLDIVLHQTSRGRDNGSAGITGTPILDGYKQDGTHLWRIDLGKNIREGEHYTQFMVYDLDGDGRAEIVCKTADGTVDGAGTVIGDGERDWRTLDEGSQRHGRILAGPEYLTVFDGKTGAALKTVDYIPGRLPINAWGGIGGNAGNDNYGNRCDRFLACVAYLDGRRPSVVMCRGVYGRIVMSAWDWRGGKLTVRWVFDTGMSFPPYENASPYAGMGGHSLSVADVDNDGKDEIVYQAMVVDDDGNGLYSTGLRHGDAMYITDIDPSREGMEVFTIQENEDDAELFQTPGAAMRDACTGEILWSHSPTVDVGGGMAADIDPRHLGLEMWGGPGGLRNAKGESIGRAPRESGWSIWWDGDPLRELLSVGRPERQRNNARNNANRTTRATDQPRPNAEPSRGAREDRDERDTQPQLSNDSSNPTEQEQLRQRLRRRFGPRPTQVTKWNWEVEQADPVSTLTGVSFSRGPNIMGDLVGDWREEILLCSPDGNSLRLYSTTIPTELRLPTLLHDPQYRLGLAWQNVVYNRPCYPSFYVGDQMETPKRPKLRLVGQGEAISLESTN